MNIRVVVYFIGCLLRFLGFLLVAPLICSLIYREPDIRAFGISAIVTLLVGQILVWSSRLKEEYEITPREGFGIAAFTWLAFAVFGSLPYLVAGTFTNFIDAFFETMSGFTTTGASVLVNIEAQPHGILFWRSFTHWLGGMGVIVLAIAILPKLAVGGMQLLSAEIPGPTVERLKPRIASTAKTLWGIYVLISGAEVVFLYLAGMPLFESFGHMFGTMATGGFSTKAASIGAYNSALIEGIIVIFMFLAGTNFVLHYHIFHGNFKKILTNSEFRFYLGVILTAIVFITFNLWKLVYPSLGASFRRAVFQAVSITTTTGYCTADFGAWPALSRWILLSLMFFGGCAGSTGGALKQMRILILLKSGYRGVLHLIHPQAVVGVRMDGKLLSEEVISGVVNLFLLYVFLFVLASTVMLILGLDLTTAISSVAATIGNIGPGLGLVGAAKNYAWISPVGKLVLCGCMLLGRLEIYTVLVLFAPSFWRK